jgi:hypothetical protein
LASIMAVYFSFRVMCTWLLELSWFMASSTIGMNHDHPHYRKLHPPPGGQFHPIDEIPERDVLGGAREGAGSLRPSCVVLHCIA